MSSNERRVYAGIPTFWRLPQSRDVTNKDITVMGVPFDIGVTNRRGARYGPRAVREISLHDMKTHYPWDYAVMEKLEMIDYVDIGVDFGTEKSVDMIVETYQHAKRIFDAGSKLLTIGGDHMIPYVMVRVVKE